MTTLKEQIQARLADPESYWSSMDESRQNQARQILDEIRARRDREQQDMYRISPLSGPSPDQLEQFPALKAAWEEYCLVHKMITGYTLEQGGIK